MTPLLAYTFSLSLPTVIGLSTFAVVAVIFLIFAIYHRDSIFLGLGGIFGVVFGFVGFGIGHPIESNIKSKEAIAAKLVAAQEHRDEMPDDWQKFYQLLKRTKSAALTKAYVLNFLVDKKEPEISAEAFESFCSGLGWSGSWNSWVAEKIAPFVHIDIKKAISVVASSPTADP